MEIGDIRATAAASAPAESTLIAARVRALAWPLTIFLLALVLRLLWLSYVHPDPRDGRYDDSLWYDSTARALTAGRGFIFEPDVWRIDSRPVYPDLEAGPTAYRPIGYPLVVAALYEVFGGSLLAGQLLNVVLGAATAVAAYAIGCLAFDRRAGVAAGLVTAAFPSHVLFSSLLMTEVTATFLLAATVWLALAWSLEGRPRPARLLALGAAVGAATLVRPEMLILPLAFAVVWWAVTGSWRAVALRLGLTAAGAALLLAPWVARNAVQMGSPVLTTSMGDALLQGHYEGSEGRPDLFVVASFQLSYHDLGNAEREVRVSRDATREALEFALTHPLDELRLTGKRLYYLYASDEAGISWTQSNRPVLGATAEERLSLLSNVYYFVVLGSAVLGAPLWFSRRKPRRLLLAAVIAVHALVFALLFASHDRYHLPLLPVFSVLAAAAWVGAVDRWRAGRPQASL